MENIPEKIYLQVDPENEQPESFDDLAEITWCRDKINDNDIEYELSGVESGQLDILLAARCATCKHWGGDKKQLMKVLNEYDIETIKKYLDVKEGWAIDGKCKELICELIFYAYGAGVDEVETPAGFSCNLYESDKGS